MPEEHLERKCSTTSEIQQLLSMKSLGVHTPEYSSMWSMEYPFSILKGDLLFIQMGAF
jgi:hypothetical protein